jgi:hypothetical protein
VLRRRLLLGGLRAVAFNDPRDAQPELLIDHDDLTVRDWSAVDQQIHRLARQAIERDDRAGTQVEGLTDGHLRAPDLNAQLQWHLADAAHVGVLQHIRAGAAVAGRARG